jgi:AcrR family transcriptional regulator
MAEKRRRSKRGRAPTEELEQRRQLYFDAALQTFLRNGYDGTTIEAIARAAGAGKITLYSKFGNKEELFRLVVRETIRQTVATLAIEEIGDQPIEQALLAIVGLLYDGFTHPSLLAVRRLVISEYLRFPELARELRSHNRELLLSLENFLQKADQRGKLVIPDCHAAALQLSTVASGGMRFLITEPFSDPKQKAFWIRSVFEFAWNSWRPDDKPRLPSIRREY